MRTCLSTLIDDALRNDTPETSGVPLYALEGWDIFDPAGWKASTMRSANSVR